MRKVAGLISNARLEVQWYPYSGALLLAACCVLMVNEHVRTDPTAQRFTPRLRALAVSVALIAPFLLPLLAHRGNTPFARSVFTNTLNNR